MNATRSRSSFAIIAASSLLLTACFPPMNAPEPMRYVAHAAPSQPAKCLFVFLPGMGDRAETFEERGFVAALRERSLSADVRAADATFGYYRKATFLDRMAADVVGPVAGNYQEIWLVGPSMGGFGSLFYARPNAAQVTGVLAIAPFLGERKVIEEIAEAGGLKNWRAPPPVQTLDQDNYQYELWRWLQAATQGREPAPLIYLGYGKADKLALPDGLLAAELPPSRVFLEDGAHTWTVWRPIFERFLDSPEFAGRCR
jgi:pimeloyl-ACP methyl ester carboxylesterase